VIAAMPAAPARIFVMIRMAHFLLPNGWSLGVKTHRCGALRMRSSRLLVGSPFNPERQLNALSERRNLADSRRNEWMHIV
jgi:hypothetical protein